MEIISNTSKSKNMGKLIDELTVDCNGTYNMGVLFIASIAKEHIQMIINNIRQRVDIRNFMACTCAGIIGSHMELEGEVGASLFLANMPKTEVSPFYISQDELEAMQTPQHFYEKLGVKPDQKPVFLVLPDPFQVDLNRFMDGMNTAYKSAPIVGGLASGSARAEGNTLYQNGNTYHQGIIGFTLTGDITVDTIVSQGCRPVGETYIVTRAQDNVIHEVAGKPVLEVIKSVFQGLPEHDRLMAQQALLIGVVMDEYKHPLKRGDFLIRSVIGIDQSAGSIVIGDSIRTGQTIQLHVRDAKAAEEDLNALLEIYKEENEGVSPQGAFVFSCNGRGTGLFQEPNHDIKIIQKHLGPIPAAGFFCSGEIGPIGGTNFIHGFTDSIVVFS